MDYATFTYWNDFFRPPRRARNTYFTNANYFQLVGAHKDFEFSQDKLDKLLKYCAINEPEAGVFDRLCVLRFLFKVLFETNTVDLSNALDIMLEYYNEKIPSK